MIGITAAPASAQTAVPSSAQAGQWVYVDGFCSPDSLVTGTQPDVLFVQSGYGSCCLQGQNGACYDPGYLIGIYEWES
jgi:hypothetical protein